MLKLLQRRKHKKQNASQVTTKFFGDLGHLEDCIERFKNDSVCTNCVSEYNIVNDCYTEIKKSTDDNFCFDIKDAMNKTRLNWSHTLLCCNDRKTSLTAFIVSSVIISVLIPFAFYTSFMFFGWRREQLHDPLIDSDNQPSASRQLVDTDEAGAVPAIANLLDLDLNA